MFASLVLIGIIVLVGGICVLHTLKPATSTSIIQSQIQSSFWSKGEKMPTPREEVAAALLDGKIYVIGGSDADNVIQDIVEVYDPRTDEWSTAAPLPEPRDHIGVAVYGGKLYVVGGFNQEDIPTDQLLIYDPKTDQWQEGRPMPAARGALAADFINGTLYAVGGVDSSHNVVSTNAAYDPKTDTWTERQPMPTARHHLSSAAVDGKLYALGGRLLGDSNEPWWKILRSNIGDNEAYDPKQNSWTILPPMPTKRSGLATAAVNSELYTFGGQSLNGTWQHNEKYDTERNVWTIDSPMLTSRLGLAAVSFENRIYVFGGKTDLGRVVGANEILHTKTGQNE